MPMPDEKGSAVAEELHVISAAVFFRRFTARQVMHFTGLGECTVKEILQRLGTSIQRTERPKLFHGGARQISYELTTHVRDTFRDRIRTQRSSAVVSASETAWKPPSRSALDDEAQPSATAKYQEIVVPLQAARDVLDRKLPVAAGQNAEGYIAFALEQIAAAEFAIAQVRDSSQLETTDEMCLDALASVSTMLLKRLTSWMPSIDVETAALKASTAVLPAPAVRHCDPKAAKEVWRRFVSTFDVQWVGPAPADWAATPSALFLVTTPRSATLDDAIAAAVVQLPDSAAVAHISGVGALASSEVLQDLGRSVDFVPTLVGILDSADLVSCVSFDWLVTRFARQPTAKGYWRELVVLDKSSSREVAESIQIFPSSQYRENFDGSRSSVIVEAVRDTRRCRKVYRSARAK